jgi:hypothetical protein
MKRVFRRPSPAMVIAIVALIAALGGTAIAAGVLSKKKVKKIANSQITKRESGLSVKNAANLGDQPPSAFQSRVQWALVNAAGTSVLAQSGGITITGHAIGRTGLRFPSGTDTSNGAIVAQVTAFGFAGTDAGLFFSKVGPCPATPDCATVGGTASTDVVIDTFAPNANFADAGAYVTFTK